MDIRNYSNIEERQTDILKTWEFSPTGFKFNLIDLNEGIFIS